MIGGWALRIAIYDALLADAVLKALVGNPVRLYDDVPVAATFPYLTLGVASASDWSTMTETGAEHQITLHVWSRYEGHKDAAIILERIETVLAGAALTMTGHALVNLQAQSTEITRDPGAPLTHGTIRFRAVTEPSA